VCQVRNRGDCRGPIFCDDEDPQRFIATLGKACAQTDWQVAAICLIGNLISSGGGEKLQANQVVVIIWFLGPDIGRFQRPHCGP